MHFELLEIIPELTQYVKSSCVISVDEAEEPVCIRVLPDGCTELFIGLHAKCKTIIDGTLYTGNFINSRLMTYADVVMEPGSSYVAICFFPGAAHYFFSSSGGFANPVFELRMISHSLTTLADDLTAKNCSAQEISLCVQKALADMKISGSYNMRLISRLLDDLQRAPAEARVATLAGKLSISERQLNRIFCHVLGVSPKEYLRLMRFLNSLNILKKQKERFLTGIALDSGYYDQAHFNHECRAFSGHSPGSLLKDKACVY